MILLIKFKVKNFFYPDIGEESLILATTYPGVGVNIGCTGGNSGLLLSGGRVETRLWWGPGVGGN